MASERDPDWAAYERTAFEFGGIRHDVLRGGTSGPVVLLLHEIPTLSWRTIRLADRIRRHGYRVTMPLLIGGRRHEPTNGVTRALANAAAGPRLIQACVSWQFVALAQGRTSPITSWLIALARHDAEDAGGGRIGVVGMCFSGGFALGTAIDPTVAVAVASQPALPFAPRGMRWIPGQAADPGLSPVDLDRLAARTAAGELCVRAYRYSDDWFAPRERIQTLCERLGDGIEFVQIQLPEGRHAHAVLTDAAVATDDDPADANGRLALRALDDLLETLEARLKRPAG